MGLRGCPRYRSLLSESSLLKHLARAHLIGPVRVRDATCAVSTALIGNHFIRICPLSERLVTELTAHRTLALRDAHAKRAQHSLDGRAPRTLPRGGLPPLLPPPPCHPA